MAARNGSSAWQFVTMLLLFNCRRQRGHLVEALLDERLPKRSEAKKP